MKEIFKDIEGYEGLYQVSNLGNVKALGNGDNNNSKQRIMKPQKNHKGYLFVNLSKEGQRKNYYIHRLVAQAFIDNSQNLPQVNHKSEIKTDNRVENLEWCTLEYNINYGTRNQRVSKANSVALKGRKLSQEWKEKISKTLSKPILQLTKDGVFIKQWDSAKQAGEELGINNITHCCKGKYKSAGGFNWQYID